MAKVDLSIIILVYNAKEYLEGCIESIKRSDLGKITWEIVLVDNLSADGSREWISNLAHKNKHITAVLNLSNLGFSKGNNTGVKIASGKYVLFLNPDTVLPSNVLQKVFDYMEGHPDVGIATPGLVLQTGELDSVSHRGYPTPWNAFSHFIGLRSLFPKSKLFAGYTMGWLIDNQEPHEVEAISGAFFFVRREVGEQTGWWDEDYFMYGEDIDFSYRIKKAGWKVMFLPGLKVLHYGGVSAGIRKHIRSVSNASPETRLRSAKASICAMRIFFEKHYKKRYSLPMRLITGIGIFLLEQLRLVQIRIGVY